MISVRLVGHENFYGVGDVLRVFGATISEDREESIVCGKLGIGDDIEIVSVYEDGKVRTSVVNRDIEILGDEYSANLDYKRETKRQLYLALSSLLGKELPWGSLTGIRPTLVAKQCGFDSQLLQEKFFVRQDKARLAVETTLAETRILETVSKDKLNVYVGVPFCPSRCAYCSFIAMDAVKHLDKLPAYADALCKEISEIGSAIRESGKQIGTIYFGGGTPTVFDEENFAKVMGAIKTYLVANNADELEFTVEAGRPDTIALAKLQAMKVSGVKRICINPQTMCDETLARYNRKHTVADVVKVFELARSLGFEINMDLIAGLNEDRPEELLESIDKLCDLKPENITIHTIYKKRRAALSRAEVLGDGADELDGVLSKAYEHLAKFGYAPYYLYRQKDTRLGLENVGFSLEKHECKYNVAMMSDERDVLAIGAGAMSKRCFDEGRVERCPCIKDAIGYITNVDEMIKKKTMFFELGGENAKEN